MGDGIMAGFQREELMGAINRFDVVSFDVFDTLIKRDVRRPTDVFSLVVPYAGLDRVVDAQAFALGRIQAEVAARRDAGVREVTLQDIYDRLEGVDAQLLLRLQEAEEEVETLVCQPSPDLFPVYEDCRRQGKTIVVLSDMYLSQNTIARILEKSGYTGYERLYVSSQAQGSKSGGTLYGHVARDLGVLPEQIIHVGNDWKSDVRNAKRSGFHGVGVPTQIRQFSRTGRAKRISPDSQLAFGVVSSFLNNRISPQWSQDYRFGYQFLGPLLYGFAQWLHQMVSVEGMDALLFLSREGQLIQKAYNKLQGPEDPLCQQYLLASRRSLGVPMLTRFSSLEEMLAHHGLSEQDDMQTIRMHLGLSHCGSTERADRRDCLKDGTLEEEVRRNAARQYQNASGYLRTVCRACKDRKVAVVDLGWNGSILHALQTIGDDGLGARTFRGYYLGLLPGMAPEFSISDHGRGFLFGSRDESNTQHVVMSSIALLELLFAADHGSVVGYSGPDQGFQPLLEEHELRHQQRRTIAQIQQGAMGFVEEFAAFNRFRLTLGPEVGFAWMGDALENPKRDLLALFDGWEAKDGAMIPLMPTQSFWQPVHFWEALRQSGWRSGYIKKNAPGLQALYLPFYRLFRRVRFRRGRNAFSRLGGSRTGQHRAAHREDSQHE